MEFLRIKKRQLQNLQISVHDDFFLALTYV
uniref:Uncharacterized protein n=1 Tax=Arundo donax TaxID=35708 RepID=A0A0A8ZK19_ARUDO